ncbi:MAG TPA: cation diffusion facilitator family transporter [Nitrospiria bacterium]|jgi:cobalt-zinc-cadmium efflux system protein
MDTFHPHQHHCDADLGHPHEHDTFPLTYLHPSRQGEQKRLLLACILTGVTMVVEFVGGFLTNSLALLSDAGHMLTHFLALGVSLMALVYTNRPPTEQKTFGFYRLEILAALFNGITLFLITGWISYHAYYRFLNPQTIESLPMFFIALLGLMVNILTAVILSGSFNGSLNVRSAFLHIIGDTFSSVAVVIGAIIIYYKGWVQVDPLLSIMICVIILVWSIRLMNDSVHILLEATPKELNIKGLIDSVQEIEGVYDVHDVHVWTLTSGMYALSAHVATQDVHLSETRNLLKKINLLLCQEFKIGHTAIQFEINEPQTQ